MAPTGKAGGPFRPRRKDEMSREEREAMAQRVMDMTASSTGTFVERLARRLEQTGVQKPTVTVEYRNLAVETDALMGSEAIPSLSNVATQKLMRLFGLLTFHKKPTRKLQILKGISGVLKPGRLTLVLGGPDSGKSVLLQTLSGRLKQSDTLRITGDVRYNGESTDAFVLERTAAHVEQLDHHLTSLTVHETLEFAYRCQYGTHGPLWDVMGDIKAAAREGLSSSMQRIEGTAGEEDDLAELEMQDISNDKSAETSGKGDMSDKEFDELVEKLWGSPVKVEGMIKIFGLTRCMDTFVGDSMTRGISGGEKKRLTTAEMVVGPKSVLFMDEISTGLDSATLFSVIRWLQKATRALGLTTVVTLLQPPPESLLLFDDIIIFNGGQVLYHGPRADAIPFFTGLGFQYPVRTDPASFLLEVTNPVGQVTYASDELKAAHGIALEAPPPDDNPSTAPQELLVSYDSIIDSYWKSQHGSRMKAELEKGFDSSKAHPQALVRNRFALMFWEMVKFVTARQWTITLRDKALFLGRVMQVVIIGLLIGSLYFDLDKSLEDSRPFMSVSFLGVMFLAMTAQPEGMETLASKPVFFKQADNNFCSATSYAWAMSLTAVPTAFCDTVAYSIVTYFMVGYTTDAAKHFFIYWLILFSSRLGMGSIFRFISSVVPNPVYSQVFGGLTILMLVINSGFTITRDSIPSFWIWAYWISPFAFALRAVVINEFTSGAWDELTGDGRRLGDVALDTMGFQNEEFWIWVGIAYLLALYVLFTLLSAAGLRYLRGEKKKAIVIDQEAVEAARRKAEKRMHELRLHERQSDVETGPISGATGEKSSEKYTVRSAVPFEQITLVWKNLRYTVISSMDGKQLQLLKGITAYAVPSTLTALMGGSGAGKTTLMDVLAGRKTVGTIEGEILVNGHPKQDATWSRVVGYVEQVDIHSPHTTVREALEISSRLRLDRSVSQEKMMAYVEETMETVELTDIQHSLVGSKGVSGLSVQQRKRLSIAVELVSNPSVVFMDEPTSGLDARAAAIVIRAVKNVAANGRTVMVTIHQPSIDIFEAFDSMVLLQLGGTVTYFGPLGHESCELISYLEAIPGVEKIADGYNPATWMLEVTGGATKTMVEASGADFPEIYKASDMCHRNAEEADRLATLGKQNSEPLSLSTRYAVQFGTQSRVLFRRFLTSYWRSPDYNLVRMVLTVAIALVYGSVYWGEGSLDDDRVEISNVVNVMGVFFSSVSFMGMSNMMNVLPVALKERTVFYRERASSMYSSFPYALAAGAVEIPFILAQALLYVPIVYFMIQFDLDAEKFFYYFLLCFLSLLLYTELGQMLVYLTPTQPVAMILGAMVSLLWNVFNGFLIARSQMPVYWRWMNRITPTSYVIYGLTVSQLGESDAAVNAYGVETTVKQYLNDTFGYEFGFRWWCVAIVMAFLIAFRVATVFALKFLNFQKR